MVENRGPELQAVCSTMVSLSFISVVLRVYVRTRIVKAFGWDDFFMVWALLFHIMFATCAIGGIHYGTGRHMKDLSDEGVLKAMRYWWYCYIAYCWAMIAVKTSIGLFLLRVTIKPIHRWIIYIVMGLTVLTGLVFFFVTLLQCAPLSYFWDKKSQTGWCVDADVIIALTFLYSAVSVICDFTFALLPIFLVWNLNMSVKTRVLLIPILGMACVASVAVLCRMAYVMDFKNPDFLWATLDIAIWSDVEQGLAITAGSLATLRPLYRKIAAHLGINTTGQGESGKNTPQWYGGRSTAKESKRKSLFNFGILMRTEKGTVRDKEENYGMGNLQPIRLRDDLVDDSQVEKSEKGFSTWTVSAGGKSFDEEHAVPAVPSGHITMQKDVVQESERRSF
ncbi:hypothetical protein BU25DRAFT_360897 [Macroventuria anomochaeta]|uniref:Uncharacterized protein n=1 Tax=Macroventuria anomochaeta TaxID=301207 RepID=A0ACB6SCS9_9PLEO|nr:uncharacterized protein BU25DRAFT_360897 [Macroventuria anomochaeta]KAF2631059.1 hypothetical protein BU25DRAFT_360897 [Macroventuria anomochaeta]